MNRDASIDLLMSHLILTADPDFVDLALDEFRRDSTHGEAPVELAPGVWLVQCDQGFQGVAERWLEAPPIFVRHINPVDVTVPLAAAPEDVPRLAEIAVAEYTGLLDPELSFSVQTRILVDLPYKPFDVNRAVSGALADATGASLDVRHPVQVLSIVCAAAPVEADERRTTNDGGRTTDDAPHAPRTACSRLVVASPPYALRPTHYAFLGLSLATHNLSDWAGGARRFAREEGQISRAEFKLLEALEVFHIHLPPRGIALDLGAAPGGWTRVLRRRAQYVTAVDPAALDPRLETDRGVRHKRMTAEAYLRQGPDAFDLIVNDMRMDARDSARLMVRYAGYLHPHGIALMTFKLPQRQRRPLIDHALDILRQAYEIAGARQLFHNRSEITVCLKRKT